MKTNLFILILASCLYLTACSSNSGSSSPGGSNPSAALTLGGTISGLTGSGLALQNNDQGELDIKANGTFTFANTVSLGEAYNVTVVNQPSNPPQFCSVVNGSGTINGNVSNVQVNCSNSYTIGGTISGFTGSTTISLQNNGGDQITLSANGPFTFYESLGTNSAYLVTVSVQPTGQTCLVTNGAGTVANSNVTNVQVICTANTYSISGTVYGLSGAGLTLQDNGGDNLAVSTDGNFTFASKIPYQNIYNVSVLNQPSNPTQTCRVPNGSGTVFSNVVGVQVVCSNGTATTNLWTWENGSNLTENAGSYGLLGVPAPSNLPPSRNGSISWKDTAGNFWLFGGTAGEAVGYFNDLWEYSAGEWTWMNGSSSISQAGSYGTLGVADPSNAPQARGHSAHWTDASGNFWLFGGYGYIASTNLSGYLSDLWKYNGAEWTWVGGPQGYDQAAVYGVMGTGAPGNIPGPRTNSVSWSDAVGNFWLFGGSGIDSAGKYGELSDIWKYDGTQWTWVGGSDLISQPAVYGTQGMPSSNNTPGGRDGSAVWTDSSGNVWLFGGEANVITQVVTYYDLNDLWEYTAGQWTWVGGSQVANQPGSWGVLGTPASTNIPGPRDSAVSWIDSAGNFWLLGGEDNSGNTYDDLWEYAGGEWTWVSGSDLCCQTGVYGTLGISALINVPGARYEASSWIDTSGDFWLFGGSNATNLFGHGEFNDLWKYQP